MRSHNLRNSIQIAIVGGNGFLGRGVIHRLSSYKNLRIFSLDKKTHNLSINTKGYKAIVQQINMDVANETAINSFLMTHPVDVILFMAGYENPTDGLGYTYREDTRALLALENTLVAINNMNLESEEQKPYFMYISSWSVYGPSKKPALESAKEYPGNYTGMLRITGEDLVKRICNKYDAPCCIVRPTEVYGKKHHMELAEVKFWPGYLSYYTDKVVKREKEITVFSPETEVDLVNINHFTKVVVDLLERGAVGTYNIASGSKTKIKDLVSKIIDGYGGDFKPSLIYKDSPNIEDMNIDSSKTLSLIPYDTVNYNLDNFIRDNLKIRKYEISKQMAIESVMAEPVILDPSPFEAPASYRQRQVVRKINYANIKQIAGDEFFKLGVGNVVRRAKELETLEITSEDIKNLEGKDKIPKELLSRVKDLGITITLVESKKISMIDPKTKAKVIKEKKPKKRKTKK